MRLRECLLNPIESLDTREADDCLDVQRTGLSSLQLASGSSSPKGLGLFYKLVDVHLWVVDGEHIVSGCIHK